MANICDNTLRVYTESKENIEYIEKFFGKWGDVKKVDSNNIEAYFDSKWEFPEEEMNKLYEGLPNKEDIDMICLSVEWGCLYCEFHHCTSDGWHF